MPRVVKKVPCPRCRSHGNDRSGDNLNVFEKGRGAYCFACGYVIVSEKYKEEDLDILEFEDVKQLPTNALKARGITKEVAEFYDVRVEYNPENGSEVAYYYPVYVNGQHTGYHKRLLPKTFSSIGETKNRELFGQNLRSPGGKFVIVTEAQDDAMAAFQIIRSFLNKTYHVVSSWGTNGWHGGVEYLSSFEKVVICFDNDAPGKKGAQQLAESLPPGKALIATLPKHDANDMLNSPKEFWDAIKNAQPIKYGGIISGAETWDLLVNRPSVKSIPYPPDWGDLQEKTGGRRFGQITLWSSGSGSGKTILLRNLRYWDLCNNPEVVTGVVSLEDPLIDEIDNLIGLHMGKRFLNETRPYLTEGYRESWEFTHNRNKLFYYDTGGNPENTADGLINKLRYMANVLGCNEITLDHITLAVAELQSEGEELKEQHLMAKLISFVKETNVHLNLISQLRKPLNGSKSWENGDMPTVNDLYGSSSIKQGSADIIFFARDQMNPDKEIRNTIQLAVGKCRKTGDTGPAGMVRFNPETGRLEGIKDDF